MADIFDTVKVLLVEDDYDGRTLLKVMLNQIGIKYVIETKNGREALDLMGAMTDGIDIILCDWNMPGMSGPELLDHVRTKNGREALDLMGAMTDGIDIILCDWNMPGMSGPELLDHVRSSHPDIPFLLITGRGDRASINEAKDFGIDGYIRKPFFPTLLEAKIRAVLHKKAIRAA